MAIIAKYNAREFVPLAAGSHSAVCTMVVTLGLQGSGKYGAREQVYLRWQVPGELVTWTDEQGEEQTRPAAIGRFYNNTLSPKSALRKDLETWRGRSFSEEEARTFDLETLLGKACLLGVVHKQEGENTYANVATISAPPKGAKPKPDGELVLFDVDNWDQAVFEKLPPWLQQRIKDRIKLAEGTRQKVDPTTAAAAVVEEEFDDALPF
jgi:hypothetical protein